MIHPVHLGRSGPTDQLPLFSSVSSRRGSLLICLCLLATSGLSVLTACHGDRGSARSEQSREQPAGPVFLTVHPAERFQTFEAWRATAAGPYFTTLDMTAGRIPAPELLSQALDDLAFDLGISGLRIEQHSGQHVEVESSNPGPTSLPGRRFDFAKPYRFANESPIIDPIAQFEQVILPLKKRVESRGEPFSTYISPTYEYAEFPPQWHDPERYADYSEAYIDWTSKSFGFVPTYWVIVNEPNWRFFWRDELAKDIAAVGARFQRRGFSTKIQAVETTVPNPRYLRWTLSNRDAIRYVGLVSYHGYDYGRMPSSFASRNEVRDLAKQIGVRTAMTEICCNSNWITSYEEALGWARDIYWNLTEADISVWEPLGSMHPCPQLGCPSGLGDPIRFDADLSRYYKFAPYYALRQFSHFIRPGFTRIGISCSGCRFDRTTGLSVKPVAFQSPSGKLIVVVINDQSSPQSISILGLSAGSYEISGVDPESTSTRAYPSQTLVANQALIFDAPPHAILTIASR
jgi:hypothetical protein